jgi:hypothetical protein
MIIKICQHSSFQGAQKFTQFGIKIYHLATLHHIRQGYGRHDKKYIIFHRHWLLYIYVCMYLKAQDGDRVEQREERTFSFKLARGERFGIRWVAV